MRLLISFFVVGLLISQEAPDSVRRRPAASPQRSRAAVARATPPQRVSTAVRFTAVTAMDELIGKAVADREIPGAVVLIGHEGRVVFHKAYGARSLTPRREVMTPETIFDAASLTKVVATTSAIMKLVEQGKVRLNDRVTVYLPDFQGGTSDITVRQLLTHYSGLRPDVDLRPEWSGYETGIQKALIDLPVAAPGSRFIYSDINFILLGEIVRKVSGKPLDQFAREEIFLPLGMTHTTFRPPAAWRAQIAPTEVAGPGERPLRGVVHDETTRFMGGVAGHAGMFTTARDLSKFAQMMLNLGRAGGRRIFSPITVQTMTSPQSPAGESALRGLGWDIDSPFSGNRGDLFPLGSYGHTGFTGTSLWIDPVTRTYVILLANAVHPQRPKLAITSLRAKVATVAAAGLDLELPLTPMYIRASTVPPRPAVYSNLNTRTGLDVLAASGFALLKGKRVGLITNHTGISRDGKRNIDLMRAAGVDLRALFSPEHGIQGTQDDEKIAHGTDAATGVPVYSLYSGPNRRPSAEMLRGIDTLVFDIQDIGTRFYTYACTMGYAMEEAARQNIDFVVLDRPNPITGEHVEGPVLGTSLRSFVGCMDIPLRHGMTIGELARMYNGALAAKARLQVVSMQDWRRSAWWDETGLPWVNPSPNMRSLNAALLYPGVGMLEYTKTYSVGRGTDAPFEQIGADWINGRQLAAYLNQRSIPGLRVYPAIFTPSASNFSGKQIEGVRFVITGRDDFDSVRLGVELAAALNKLFPGKMTYAENLKLVGSETLLGAIQKGEPVDAVVAGLDADVRNFLGRRSEFLLY